MAWRETGENRRENKKDGEEGMMFRENFVFICLILPNP